MRDCISWARRLLLAAPPSRPFCIRLPMFCFSRHWQGSLAAGGGTAAGGGIAAGGGSGGGGAAGGRAGMHMPGMPHFGSWQGCHAFGVAYSDSSGYEEDGAGGGGDGVGAAAGDGGGGDGVGSAAGDAVAGMVKGVPTARNETALPAAPRCSAGRMLCGGRHTVSTRLATSRLRIRVRRAPRCACDVSDEYIASVIFCTT